MVLVVLLHVPRRLLYLSIRNDYHEILYSWLTLAMLYDMQAISENVCSCFNQYTIRHHSTYLRNWQFRYLVRDLCTKIEAFLLQILT